MKLYNKKSAVSSFQNTKIEISIKGDGSEIFDFGLPHPFAYKRASSERYTLTYILDGTFNTSKGYGYLNDVLARFTLSMNVVDTSVQRVFTKDYRVSSRLDAFRGLKSVTRYKDYEKVNNGQDNVFWAIKLHTEKLIRESGEGNLIAYSLLESFAFDMLEAKDKSTLKAKCRSIWNWYNDREWTIQTRKGKGMSRQEGAKIAHTELAKKTKAKVVGAIEALTFLQEKLSIANVAKQAQVSRDTAKKYLIELGHKKK